MSFAQGFQAGSAAVTRGLQLRDKRLEREKQEEYQAKLKEYDDQYRQGLSAEEQYANQLAGSGAQTPQVPLQPLAPAASAGAGRRFRGGRHCRWRRGRPHQWER